MEKIHIDEIKAVLQQILDEEISRQDAASWALKLRESGDYNNLKFIPDDFEQTIWESLLFIEGLDLRDTPSSYLHNSKDILLFLQNL